MCVCVCVCVWVGGWVHVHTIIIVWRLQIEQLIDVTCVDANNVALSGWVLSRIS